MRKLLFIALMLITLGLFGQTNTPIPASQAFIFSIRAIDSQTIIAHWQIQPGYYLYQERFKFVPQHRHQIKLGPPIFPQGIAKTDPELGSYHVYQNEVSVSIPVLQAKTPKIGLYITYQGCSQAGFCYPPMTKLVQVNLASNFNQPSAEINEISPSTVAPVTSQEKVMQLLINKNILTILISFLGFGLLLSFTPCVLPMIPILSSIIIGHGHHITTGKAFRLSLVYVLSMSLTYAVAGVLVGYLGGSLQAIFQKPWVLITFSIIFILLALSLFGLYNLQPPQKLERYLANISEHQKKGNYIGVAVMGCLGTLIISPCVTPPLIGALSYIGQSGNAIIGGVALFATGLGMGLPLLLIGTSGRKFLPKAGRWMNTVKSILGVFLLAVAISLLGRVIPGPVTLVLWAILLIGCAVYMGALTNGNKTGFAKIWRGFAIVILIYGVLLIIGAALGNDNPLQPFAKTRHHQANVQFQTIKTLDDLDKALATAKVNNKPTMLDFYADWCLSCKFMDRNTFANTDVENELTKFNNLRTNVTANDDGDKILLQNFDVIAPPTILFFAPDGHELRKLRIVGEMDANDFLQHLRLVEAAITNP